MTFWTYMLYCRGGIFSGPVSLVWSEAFAIREEALAMERRIKGWSRAKKLALIRADGAEISRLASKDKNRPSTSSGRTGN